MNIYEKVNFIEKDSVAVWDGTDYLTIVEIYQTGPVNYVIVGFRCTSSVDHIPPAPQDYRLCNILTSTSYHLLKTN